MIQDALNFAQQRPFVSGLIVLGAGALGYFALRGTPQSDTPSMDASALYTRPSDAEIAAASNIAVNQMALSRASEDAQIAAVLASKSLDYEYDLERGRVNNAMIQVQGLNAIELRKLDVAELTAANDYGLGLAAITSQYNTNLDTLKYTTALDALKTNTGLQRDMYVADTDLARTTIQSNNDVASARIAADAGVAMSTLDYNAAVESARVSANAQVAAAKASKKRGFSFGPFSLSF